MSMMGFEYFGYFYAACKIVKRLLFEWFFVREPKGSNKTRGNFVSIVDILFTARASSILSGSGEPPKPPQRHYLVQVP